MEPKQEWPDKRIYENRSDDWDVGFVDGFNEALSLCTAIRL